MNTGNAAWIRIAPLPLVMFAVGCSGGPVVPVDTTQGEILDGALEVGTAVSFDAYLLPDTYIHTSEVETRLIGESRTVERYCVLAVDADSTFEANIQRFIADLESFQAEVDELSGKLDDDGAFAAFEERRAKLVERAGEVEPLIGETVVIQLVGLDEVGRTMDWNRVHTSRSSPSYPYPTHRPFEPPKIPKFEYKPILALSSDLEEADALMDAAEATDPPDLSLELPELTLSELDRWNSSKVRRFNRLVRRHNRELSRRRAYYVQLVPAELEMTAIALRHLIASEPIRIVGRLEAVPGEVRNTYRETSNTPPGWFVSELGGEFPPAQAEITGHTDLLVMSYPPGAELSVDGELRGTTPLVLDRLEPGSTMALSAELKGYETQGQELTVPSTPEMFDQVVLDLVGVKKR